MAIVLIMKSQRRIKMDCQICGREITGSMSVCFGESIIAHIACMHKAEERAEHEAKAQKRGEA